MIRPVMNAVIFNAIVRDINMAKDRIRADVRRFADGINVGLGDQDNDLSLLRGLGVYRGDSLGGGYTLIESSAPAHLRLPLLGVAHLDYVAAHIKGGTVGNSVRCVGGGRVVGSALDDRLGVWGLRVGLPDALAGGRKGASVPYDILLTEDEESGSSTARDFYRDGRLSGYKWVFSLDRAGADCAYYGFTDRAWLAALRADGWDTSVGSYSCIGEFELGKVCGINFGVGYYGQHTADCYCEYDNVRWQLQRVAHFIKRWGRTEFSHVPVVNKWGDWSGGYGAARDRAVNGVSGDYWDSEWGQYGDQVVEDDLVDDTDRWVKQGDQSYPWYRMESADPDFMASNYRRSDFKRMAYRPGFRRR